ncbi:hypothetical protein M0Q28_04250 [Patescibacteria group bacterium]|jgi:hypothetical protein|nr:hypothetical protein [Patescibacteria group bacterium]
MQQSTKRSFVLPVYGYEEHAKAELAKQVRRALRTHLAERGWDFDPEEFEESFDSALFSEPLQRIPVPAHLKRAS